MCHCLQNHHEMTSFDNQKVVLLVLLDLSAAFDVIDHTILLKRLSQRIGIQGRALDWIASYLVERQQKVKVEGSFSSPSLLLQGVPQGSVLGPLLFTLYTSPLSDVISKHDVRFHAYADDTQLYMSFCPNQHLNATEAVTIMQNCITDIRSWMIMNFLKLNEDKTEFAILGLSQQTKKVSIQSMNIHGCEIEPKESVKNLGAIFDSQLKMDKHGRNIVSSANYHLRNIRRVRRFMNTETSKTAVNAFVISRIDTNNALLAGANKGILKGLKKVQNTAAKVILKKRKYDEATPLLESLNWLPVCEKRGKRYYRTEFKCLLLTFKAIHGMGPAYLSELVSLHQPSRSLRSENRCLLVEPKTSLVTGGDRAFVKVAPTLWNSLPLHLRECDSLSKFKRQLKTHLYSQAYPKQ